MFSLFPTWANCGDARCASCPRESEPATYVLLSPPCNRGLGRTGAERRGGESIRHSTWVSIAEQLHNSRRGEAVDHRRSRPVGHHSAVAGAFAISNLQALLEDQLAPGS